MMSFGSCLSIRTGLVPCLMVCIYMIVTAVTVIAMVTIYLKSKGLLEEVNDSHITILENLCLDFSVFWTLPVVFTIHVDLHSNILKK